MIDHLTLTRIFRDILNDRGEVTFFAAFEREEAEGKWDLVVAAPWLEENEAAGLRYLAETLSSKLDTEEIVDVSRIVIVAESDPALASFMRRLGDRAADGTVGFMLHGGTFGDLAIKRGMVLCAREPEQKRARMRRGA